MRICKFCKTPAVTDRFGSKWEIYCPNPDSSKCPYPPCIEGEDLSALEEQWDNQFNYEEPQSNIVSDRDFKQGPIVAEIDAKLKEL